METTLEQTETKCKQLENYELLADLFIYPQDESYKKKIKNIHDYLLKCSPESAEAMKLFIEFTETSTMKEMQELFLRSFDVQAVTTLDIGFILFGEDYKRGQLLVHLNREHREAGNDCGVELSDHLPNVLRLLSKMKDEAMRNEIATRLVIPAIVKMMSEFSVEKIEKKDVVYKKHQKTILDYSQKYRRVYQTLLQALFIALKKDFGYESIPTESGEVKNASSATACVEPSSCSCGSQEKDFKQNIETEMLIEKE